MYKINSLINFGALRTFVSRNEWQIVKRICPNFIASLSTTAEVPASCSNQPQPQKLNPNVISRSFSHGANTQIPVATYEEVKDLPNHPEKYLIDVREPAELLETGQIPTSINIPLADVENALSKNLSEADFLKTFGRTKPKHGDEIIFHCKIGRRSQTASEKAASLGYGNVRNYVGSWDEWAQCAGLAKK